ncbi:hypothetical protein [Adhaeribacter radiodurans]|uniref:T9SS C-terminal target domain-containing protein n=1 Tax=Adhaeribacter radiodurans TaxID=2745197 RepID=A0A7L7L4Z2_9BACT|nr:hypothetical protein [Adhaeribacter radiodurans]QMU27872.1 hypothetical protein HUW48_07370 [Adhaeribacter radiodurans]
MLLHLGLTTITFGQKNLWDKAIGGRGEEGLRSFQQTSDGGYILGGNSSSGSGGDKTEANRGTRGTTDYWIVKLNANGTKEWDKTLGGDRNDKLISLQQTNDEGYIVIGSSNSAKLGDKSEAAAGSWIVKLNADGNKEWDNTISGGSISSLQQTRDGVYILGGTSASGKGGDKSEDSKGKEDFWIVKLKADGSKDWDKTIGGNNYDWLTAVYQTSDDGYILAGSSWSGKSGDKTQASQCYSDYWIVKLKADGSKEWDKTEVQVSSDYLEKMQLTRDGGYILLGASHSGELRIGPFIVKLKADGTKEWDKTISGDGYEWLSVIQQTSDNGFILGGYKEREISNVPTNLGWVVKLKADGATDWDTTLKRNNSSSIITIQQTSDGGYILGGPSSVYLGDEFADGWVMKLNNEGNITWDKTYGGDYNDFFSSIQQTKDGNYVLVGSSASTTRSDSSQTSRGGSDYWIMRLDNSGSALPQKIVFTPLSNKSLNDKPFSLFATATSDLPVTFTIVSGPAKIKGNIVTLTGTGIVTVRAIQAGNATYLPAEVVQSFLVEPASIVNKLWDKTIGGNESDFLSSVQQTRDGGYILGGTSSSTKSGDKTEGNKGDCNELGCYFADYWVVKLKADGTKEWDKTIGSDGKEELIALQQTNDGGYILGGGRNLAKAVINLTLLLVPG